MERKRPSLLASGQVNTKRSPLPGVGNNFPGKGQAPVLTSAPPLPTAWASERTCPVTAALSLCERPIQLRFRREMVSCLDNGRGEAGPDSGGQRVPRLEQQVGREAGGREAGHFPQMALSRQPLGMGWACTPGMRSSHRRRLLSS